MTQIWVSKLTNIVDRPAPIHYVYQRWNSINWTLGNKLQWNPNRNLYIFIQENARENVVCRIAAIFLGLNVLTSALLYVQCILRSQSGWGKWFITGKDTGGFINDTIRSRCTLKLRQLRLSYAITKTSRIPSRSGFSTMTQWFDTQRLIVYNCDQCLVRSWNVLWTCLADLTASSIDCMRID